MLPLLLSLLRSFAEVASFLTVPTSWTFLILDISPPPRLEPHLESSNRVSLIFVSLALCLENSFFFFFAQKVKKVCAEYSRNMGCFLLWILLVGLP